MEAFVPTAIIENEYELFPEGRFVGSVGDAKTREFDSGDTIVQVSMRNTEPLTDEDPDTNGRAFTGRVQMSVDGTSLLDIPQFDNSVDFRLRKAAGLLGGLAVAVGAVVKDEETGGVYFNLGDFVDSLLDGEYKDAKAAFIVRHNNWTDKEGEAHSRDEYWEIGPIS